MTLDDAVELAVFLCLFVLFCLLFSAAVFALGTALSGGPLP